MMKMMEKPKLLKDLGTMYPSVKSKKKARYGLYKCRCGQEFRSITYNVNNGNTNSCGCYQVQRSKEASTKHGLHNHRLYRTWDSMMQRCNNEKREEFKYYGAIGIKVCERWTDVANFIEDMYPTYKEGLTIDRIDSSGNYEPNNCRWETKSTQTSNTRRIMSTNTSGYRGVSFKKSSNKWSAQISVNNKLIYLGLFDSPENAAAAYDAYIIENNLKHTING